MCPYVYVYSFIVSNASDKAPHDYYRPSTSAGHWKSRYAFFAPRLDLNLQREVVSIRRRRWCSVPPAPANPSSISLSLRWFVSLLESGKDDIYCGLGQAVEIVGDWKKALVSCEWGRIDGSVIG
ncbi:hypothetical protein BHM03_00058355 [Ensete ventricosum]|nr:hypothetical protein BHM03_00058355 [Ensete ventricosum]